MRWFSERMGFKKGRESLQLEELDDATRQRIWNLLGNFFTRKSFNGAEPHMQDFLEELWDKYFKNTHDHLRALKKGQIYSHAKKYVIISEWNEVYDFIEAILHFFTEESQIEWFKTRCNKVLEEEKSGYRIVGNLVVPIIVPDEIAEIEEALSHPYSVVVEHLQRALSLFSNREIPDYTNAVKDAILAVECTARIILQDKKITLGAAIKNVGKKLKLHKAFVNGVGAFYGWTSTSAGTRHGKIDDAEMGFDEAKFMIVLCSAFINFLFIKAEKLGIDLLESYEIVREK